MWLSKTLPPGSLVGVDPKLFEYRLWEIYRKSLELTGQKLVPVKENLVDLIWKDKPPRPTDPVQPLSLIYTGKRVQEKLEDIRKEMKEKDVSAIVISSLDTIAWVLNLRGNDVLYNPVFFSYLIIYDNSLTLFIDSNKITPEVKEHFKNEIGTSCLNIMPYESIYEELKEATDKLEGLVWLNEGSNYALVSLIPQKKLYIKVLPPTLMKLVKNPVEIEGMKKAHIRDAVALISYFAWLEKNLKTMEITEVSGAEKLEKFRKEQCDNMGLSFGTINSMGPHGAIIHYKPDKNSDIRITDEALYLCDSGGQYRDGTTDITRTLHFGTPTAHEKECFTRVLKGQIAIATSIFPYKLKGNQLDSFARQYLWEVGLDYSHGTGHGVGSFLNVHEYPIGITYKNIPDEPGLEPGMFLSNEPGYYEDGKFGIRIEDIILVVNADTPNNFNNSGFLCFETVSLVPIQTKLIEKCMLNEKEIKHINDYHKKCRDVLGPVFDAQGKKEAKEWLWKETEPI